VVEAADAYLVEFANAADGAARALALPAIVPSHDYRRRRRRLLVREAAWREVSC
jgi:hypothetical protein